MVWILSLELVLRLQIAGMVEVVQMSVLDRQNIKRYSVSGED